MFNIQKHLRHVALALGLAAASMTASASLLPTYHIVAADTVTADIAAIDIVFGSVDGAATASATLSHLTGSALSELDRQGAVAGGPDSFVFANTGSYNDLYLGTSGPFAFDLNFSESFLSVISEFGSSFSITLYDSFGNPIGDGSPAVNFSLLKTGVTFAATSSLLAVTAVPEPADWVLVLTGLVFVVYMTRLNARSTGRRIA